MLKSVGIKYDIVKRLPISHTLNFLNIVVEIEISSPYQLKYFVFCCNYKSFEFYSGLVLFKKIVLINLNLHENLFLMKYSIDVLKYITFVRQCINKTYFSFVLFCNY